MAYICNFMISYIINIKRRIYITVFFFVHQIKTAKSVKEMQILQLHSIQYLERYIYLILFNAYLHLEKKDTWQRPFSKWMYEVCTVYLFLSYVYLATSSHIRCFKHFVLINASSNTICQHKIDDWKDIHAGILSSNGKYIQVSYTISALWYPLTIFPGSPLQCRFCCK